MESNFAMDFLPQQNKRNFGDALEPASEITANGKRVVILGGGDTGSDCLGTSNRQGAIVYISSNCSRCRQRNAPTKCRGPTGR